MGIMAVLGKLRNHPDWLEIAYKLVDRLFKQLEPGIRKIGYQRFDWWMQLPEKLSKGAIFDCQMCGQCTLHFTGMTCPMTCPKNLRNGPCGGVQSNENCEVKPDMKCIWVEAYERSIRMKVYGNGIYCIQEPLNHQLKDSSAFINILTIEGGGTPAVWKSVEGGFL